MRRSAPPQIAGAQRWCGIIELGKKIACDAGLANQVL